jgi:hypothetical protein
MTVADVRNNNLLNCSGTKYATLTDDEQGFGPAQKGYTEG